MPARAKARKEPDVVRYADTSGDNSDFPVPSMFRYRNWVIAAFNKDEPYNQFLREQLAGLLENAWWGEGSAAPEAEPARAPSRLSARES